MEASVPKHRSSPRETRRPRRNVSRAYECKKPRLRSTSQRGTPFKHWQARHKALSHCFSQARPTEMPKLWPENSGNKFLSLQTLKTFAAGGLLVCGLLLVLAAIL
jgi:hypothetical protein